MKLSFLIRLLGVLGLLVPGIAFSADCPTGLTCVDLTVKGTQETINGALYTTPGKTTSGTGLIDSFVQIGGNTSPVQGYNTSDANQFDEGSSPQFNHDLLYSSLLTNTVTVGGIEYIEFVLDINQTGESPLLSLDQLKIYSTPGDVNTAVTGYDEGTGTLGGFSPIYDMDAGLDGDVTVLLNYSNFTGSGTLDLLVLIPKNLFCPVSGCVTTGPVADQTHVYLFSQFGAAGGVYENNDGFEEWAHKVSGTFTPEPGMIALLLIGLAGVVFVTRRQPVRLGPQHAALC